jgi:hypothetical protein
VPRGQCDGSPTAVISVSRLGGLNRKMKTAYVGFKGKCCLQKKAKAILEKIIVLSSFFNCSLNDSHNQDMYRP